MSINKTKWMHHYDIRESFFRFRADFIDLKGAHCMVGALLKEEDLCKKGRLAVKLRAMQRAINQYLETQRNGQ